MHCSEEGGVGEREVLPPRVPSPHHLCLESDLQLWFIEAWKNLSGPQRLQLSAHQVPVATRQTS